MEKSTGSFNALKHMASKGFYNVDVPEIFLTEFKCCSYL